MEWDIECISPLLNYMRTDGKRFLCTGCSKSFISVKGRTEFLEKHLLEAHAVVLYKCPGCPRCSPGAGRDGEARENRPHTNDSSTPECAICLETLFGLRPTCSLQCGHVFHESCISRVAVWCPICKGPRGEPTRLFV